MYQGPRRRYAYARYRRLLDSAPWDDQSAMETLQSTLLAKLISEAGSNVAFQRERFTRSGIDPARVRTIGDLATLPPVSKTEMLAAGYPALVNLALGKRLMWPVTSGSSGEPFKFAVDPFFHSRSDAVRGYVYKLDGFSSGVAVEMYLGRGATGDRDPGIGSFDRHIIGYGGKIEDRAAQIVSINPHLLYGNVSQLLELAEHLSLTNQRLPRLAHVISSSEPLHNEHRRRFMECFGVRVRDVYGLAEVSGFCFEREPGRGYSVVEPRVIVELLIDGKPAERGEVGEVVVTSLDNAAMPFIRFATGDFASLAPSSAESGRPGMLLADIQGRAVDTISRPDGSLVPYGPLGNAPWGLPEVFGNVNRWQIVQEQPDLVRVRIVLRDRSVEVPVLQAIETALSDVLGPSMRLIVEPVGDIAREANGKFRAIKVLRPFIDSGQR